MGTGFPKKHDQTKKHGSGRMRFDGPNVVKSEAYYLGGVVLFGAAAIIIAALLFEHVGGYAPCPLCLQQRYAYYSGIPLAFLALVSLSAGQRRLAGGLFLVIALAFLINAGLGVYQSGAEWGWWPGPATCAGGADVIAGGGDLLSKLENTRVVRCDEASWRFAQLSFAGWNAVLSLILSILSLKAALLSAYENK